MFVYVLNCHGKPLMPCRPRKARLLLKAGQAKVVKMVPFTLQLHYGSSGYTQEVSLGIDAGTRYIGVSATTEKVVLFEAEVQPRTDLQEVLATRRQFRRARRKRKTRYRPCRFLNRRKPEGWLAPSVRHLVEAHLKTIRLVHRILPVRRTTIEVAQFDLQKIHHPEMEGKAYQEGPQLGFWKVREYVLFRDQHSCQWCLGRSKDKILNVHHAAFLPHLKEWVSCRQIRESPVKGYRYLYAIHAHRKDTQEIAALPPPIPKHQDHRVVYYTEDESLPQQPDLRRMQLVLSAVDLP